MKADDVKIGETYWLRFPHHDPAFAYHGRVLVSSKGETLSMVEYLDSPHPDFKEYFHYRLLELSDAYNLTHMGLKLMEIDHKLSALFDLGVNTKSAQAECEELRKKIQKKLEGNP